MVGRRFACPTLRSWSLRGTRFLLAQAGVFAVGNAYKMLEQRKVGKDNLMSWYEEVDDFGNENGIGVGSVFGMKAARFNSKDFGKIVISSYAESHSS